MPPEHVPAVLLALGDGITEQHLLDPDDVPMGLFDQVLDVLLAFSR